MDSVSARITNSADLPAFANDLHLILDSGNRPIVDKCLGWLEAYIGATSDAQRQNLVTELARHTETEPRTGHRILQILAFLASGFPPPETIAPEQAAGKIAQAVQQFVAQDEALRLSEEELPRLRELLSALALRVPELTQAAVTSAAVRGVLPMFEGLDATVELRSTHQPLDGEAGAHSGALKLVPLASLRLRLDSGDPAEICFQATEADLTVWIERLRRLQVALTQLKESVIVQELPHA